MDFDDMNLQQRRAWLAWCKAHDWGISARFSDSCVQITGLIDYTSEGTEIEFSVHNTADLIEWAGY